MNPPEVTCTSHPGSITITLDLGSWPCSRDFFMLLADAIGDKAEGLHRTDKEDAVYLESIANTIAQAVQKTDKQEQDDIADIFG